MTGTHPAIAAWMGIRPDTHTADVIDVHTIRRRGDQQVQRLTLADGEPHIIMKRDRVAGLAISVLVTERMLPHIGVDGPRYFGSLRSPESDELWLAVEEVIGEPYSSDDERHRRLAGTWLGVLHRDAAELPSDGLPDRNTDYYLHCLRSGRAVAARHRDASRSSPAVAMLDRLVGACDDLAATWPDVDDACRGLPTTLVHNDFVAHNVLVAPTREAPTLMVFDWEHAGRGTPAADLHRFVGPSVSPMIDAYAEVVIPAWPSTSPDQLRSAAIAGGLLRCTQLISWDAEALAAGWVDSSLARLDAVSTHIERLLPTL